MLQFAVTLARSPEKLDDSNYEALREHGFTEDDIWDIGAITGLFALSNRMAHVTAMMPNEEFYPMGRG